MLSIFYSLQTCPPLLQKSFKENLIYLCICVKNPMQGKVILFAKNIAWIFVCCEWSQLLRRICRKLFNIVSSDIKDAINLHNVQQDLYGPYFNNVEFVSMV